MERLMLESHSEVISEMQKLRKRGIIRGNTACLRHFNSDRTEILVNTGTDRDNGSIVHTDKTDFSQGRGCYNPKNITYVRVVDLDSNPPLSIPIRRNPSPLIDGMEYLGRLSPHFNQVVYDPEKLYRVSENEFWFKGDPKEALLVVIEIKKK